MENKKTFFEWFIHEGYSLYTIPYVIYSGITYAVYKSIQDITEAPLIVQIGLAISYFGFGIGITYHMVQAYKLSDK